MSVGIRFGKYSGAGNDFVLVRAEDADGLDPSALARRMCARATGIGVDGLILLAPLEPDLVRVRFFNPDGSEFSTCGNGSRCAARHAVESGMAAGPRLRLRTDAGDVVARLGREEDVALDYRLDAEVEREIEVRVEGRARAAWLVAIGTPHLVVPLEDAAALEALPREAFEDVSRPLRRDPRLGPRGANVDLVVPTGGDEGLIRTFERGVEGETLACGSGAMAAALVLHAAGRSGSVLRLRTRSGDVVIVELAEVERHERGDGGAGGAVGDPTGARGRLIRLIGPARHTFDGTFPRPA